jgi:hypothetical protein
MDSRQITDTGSKRLPLRLQPYRLAGSREAGRVRRWWRGTSASLAPKLVFEAAPLPAKLCLMRRAAGNRFRIVLRQRQAARFQASGQSAHQRQPLLDQFAELGKRGVDRIHRSSAFRRFQIRQSKRGIVVRLSLSDSRWQVVVGQILIGSFLNQIVFLIGSRQVIQCVLRSVGIIQLLIILFVILFVTLC